MLDFLIEMLQCPACRGALAWQIDEQRGEHIETAGACCVDCGASYPVREGIGVFLTPDLPRDDLWEELDSRLSRYLQAHPKIESRLMGAALETLAPADQFYRALVLEERGEFAQAGAILEAVYAGLYTPEYLICYESQVHYLLDALKGSDSPVVDLASGRCDLVEQILRHVDRPIIATDFSPSVLRRDRRWLSFLGLYERVSLLAFDARRTPFKDGVLPTLTTNAGLANIREPGDLLKELRRVVSGEFLAISPFYPDEDEANRKAIQGLGLSAMLYRPSAYKQFAAAGWKMRPRNACQGRALPTPTSTILDGASIDSLPVAETELEWCTLVAR